MRKIIFLASLLMTMVLIGGTIDLNNLDNYANQTLPSYIQKDNTAANAITDAAATLGRVLFYDKQLSANQTISCSSCHQQAFAFGDPNALSLGLNGGLTGRQSMRLINSRFADEPRFFWDERAESLEAQSTMPIQDHVEMGFSGTNGDPDLDSLIRRLEGISYYQQLFEFVYGDATISESRIQQPLAQFIRSIQSFDSKYDIGRAQVPGDLSSFPNFTAIENQGKALFLQTPPQGGAGCGGCHRAPEFDIDSASLNNGVIGVAGSPGTFDFTVTRAPSLRDLFNPDGTLNTPLMHTGGFNDIQLVINHYNLVPQNPNNNNLDPRLQGPGANLNLSQQDKAALEAFMRTLTGTDVYTHPKWSDPFDSNGNIDVILLNTALEHQHSLALEIYPNPAIYQVQIQVEPGNYLLSIMDIGGRILKQQELKESQQISVEDFPSGILLFDIQDLNEGTRTIRQIKVIK